MKGANICMEYFRRMTRAGIIKKIQTPLWIDNKMTRITYNLKDQQSASEERLKPPKKPWWKFWR
jgi:hypothetical protein